MKKILCFLIVFSMIATIYVKVVDPFLYAKFIENEVEMAGTIKDLNNNNATDTNKQPSDEGNKDTNDNSTPDTNTGNNGDDLLEDNSGSNNDENDTNDNLDNDNGEEPEESDKKEEIEYVYYTQDKSVTGLTGACLLTSFAMLITNAGRIVGTPKEYGPVDVYLANNPEATKKSDRRIISYYYVIADGFNHKWVNVSNAKTMSSSEREAKVKELLKTHPWGVIIGGVYGSDGTHYIAVRSDGNGGLLFDDPVKSRGPNLKSISDVYGINDWSKIRQIMTIEPNLDSNGKWKDGVYDKCKKNPSNCHVCSTKVDC